MIHKIYESEFYEIIGRPAKTIVYLRRQSQYYINIVTFYGVIFMAFILYQIYFPEIFLTSYLASFSNFTSIIWSSKYFMAELTFIVQFKEGKVGREILLCLTNAISLLQHTCFSCNIH